MSVALRYTPVVGQPDLVLEYVRQLKSRVVVIEHQADAEVSQTHWHAILWSKKVESVRQALKRAVPDLDKSSYALKAIIPDEEDVMLRYMCHSSGKGEKVVILHSSDSDLFGPVEAVELNLEFYRKQEAFKESKSPKNKAAWVNKLFDKMFEVSQTDEWPKVSYLQRYLITETMMNFVVETPGMVLNVNYIASVVDSVCFRLNLKGFRHSTIVRIMEAQRCTENIPYRDEDWHPPELKSE